MATASVQIQSAPGRRCRFPSEESMRNSVVLRPQTRPPPNGPLEHDMSRELRFGRPAHVGVIPLGDGLACSRSARSNPQPVHWFGGVASLRKHHQENLTQFGHLFKTSAQASLRSEKVSGLDRNGCPTISETSVRNGRTAQLLKKATHWAKEE